MSADDGRESGAESGGLTIRPYDEADEAAVADLWRAAFPDAPAHNDPERDIERKLAVQRELFLVALRDGRVVGTAMAGYDGHRGWVYYVAVDPKQRRQRIGAALMRRVEHDLAAIGCPKLNLQVRSTNSEVVAFYRKLGYAVEDRASMGRKLDLAAVAGPRECGPSAGTRRIPLNRCIVRSWREEDAGPIAVHADNRDVAINLRDGFPHPYTEGDARAFISRARGADPETMFAIEVDGQAVGGIGFGLHDDVERVSAEIGYWLAEPYWGRGITTEALRAVTAHAISEHGLTRVYAVPYEWNSASFRVLEKAGYVLEARMRRSAIKDGRVVDQLLYAYVNPS